MKLPYQALIAGLALIFIYAATAWIVGDHQETLPLIPVVVSQDEGLEEAVLVSDIKREASTLTAFSDQPTSDPPNGVVVANPRVAQAPLPDSNDRRSQPVLPPRVKQKQIPELLSPSLRSSRSRNDVIRERLRGPLGDFSGASLPLLLDQTGRDQRGGASSRSFAPLDPSRNPAGRGPEGNRIATGFRGPQAFGQFDPTGRSAPPVGVAPPRRSNARSGSEFSGSEFGGNQFGSGRGDEARFDGDASFERSPPTMPGTRRFDREENDRGEPSRQGGEADRTPGFGPPRDPASRGLQEEEYYTGDDPRSGLGADQRRTGQGADGQYENRETRSDDEAFRNTRPRSAYGATDFVSPNRDGDDGSSSDATRSRLGNGLRQPGIFPLDANERSQGRLATPRNVAPLLAGDAWLSPGGLGGDLIAGRCDCCDGACRGGCDCITSDSSPCEHCNGEHRGCEICNGVGDCATCCQPMCLTRTILVPQWYTVWSTVSETRFRPQVLEEPYMKQETVTHNVPVIETFPVIVREPRVRNFKTYRKEEYQVPREVEYTVMVPKPATRQVTSERVEEYEVPYEEQYSVEVPVKKEVRKTKYKIVKDREPVFKEYVVMVPQQRKRVKIDYETRTRTFVKKVPFTRNVERQLTRQVTKYRSEVRQVEVVENYFEYESQEQSRDNNRIVVVKGEIPSTEEYIEYSDRPAVVNEQIAVQERVKKMVEQSYTVTVPYKEEIEEEYYENESYEETADREYTVKTPVARDVVKPYQVKLPYVEHVPQNYTIRIPYEARETKYREIPKQVPVTKYQMVKRDLGKWVTRTIKVNTYEEGEDLCGCPTCCPANRTIRKTIWKPRVVTQKLPYTTFKTVKQRVPYEVPVMKYRQEQRQRMIEITKYRTEVRQAVEKQYSFESSQKTRSYPVTKFRLVRKTRPKTVTRYREETRTKQIPVNEYVTKPELRRTPYTIKEAKVRERDIRLPATREERVREAETYTVNVPVPRQRKIIKNVTVRVPVPEQETYTVEVPVIDYREVNETEEYQVEIPREVTYTVQVPEIRTKKEFVEVERKVPYVETSYVTEMIPEIRTRRVYKTESRTVSDVRTETYMTSEPEVVTKTVYDKKTRDIPVFQSELYWENVTKTLKKTVFKPVTRTISRPAIRRRKVNVPYQVNVRVPRRVSRLVPRTITIPIEPCCDQCCVGFDGVTNAFGDYLRFGLVGVRDWLGASELVSVE